MNKTEAKYLVLFCWETDKDKRTFHRMYENYPTIVQLEEEIVKGGGFLNDEKQRGYRNVAGGEKYKWVAITDIKIIDGSLS